MYVEANNSIDLSHSSNAYHPFQKIFSLFLITMKSEHNRCFPS